MTVPTSRLPVIDALRGIALFGILIVNQADLQTLGLVYKPNIAYDAVIGWLFSGKFILIFAFLFGWGLYTQATHGEAFRSRYRRRLLGLSLLGIVHAAFFFYGDILVAYALLGLLMLRPVSRHWSVRRLVRSAVILLAVQAVIVLGLAAISTVAPFGDAALLELARRAELYGTGGFLSVLPQRLSDFATYLITALTIESWGLVAMFRLGLAAAKTFAEGGAEAARPLAKRVLWPALILGLTTNAVWPFLAVYGPASGLSEVVEIQRVAFTSILSLGYIAAAVLLLTGPVGSRLVSMFAAAGRMSLSVYVAESVVLSLLFHGYGLGLDNTIGWTGALLVCIAVYAALDGFCALWLSHFRIGPLEWMLRSITEARPVALRPRREARCGAPPAPTSQALRST